jgi:outer membrane protein assembly factor BamB
VAWQLPLEDPLAAPPAYENGWLVVATQGGKIAALRADTGGIVWQRDIGSPAHTRPTLFDDRVYVPANDGRIVALKIESGEPVWERRLGGAPAEILSLGERMYVGTSDNFFYCLIAKDGTVDWRWRTGGDVVGQPVADERYVFFVALDNLLRAMDRKTGAQVWVRPLPVRPIAGALLAGSTLLVAGLPAQLRAFNAKDGTPAAGEPIVPGARGPATAAIKTVYVPGLDIPLRPIADTDLAASVPSKIPTEVEIPSGSATAPSKIANIANDAETAAPPHLILDPETKLPMVLMLTRDVARGAGVTLLTRDFDPAVAPLSPLPNMVMIAPQTPQTQRR